MGDAGAGSHAGGADRFVIELGVNNLPTGGNAPRGRSASQAHVKFSEALQRVRSQLAQLSVLVDLLAEQHEYEVTVLTIGQADSVPEASNPVSKASDRSLVAPSIATNEEFTVEYQFQRAVVDGDADQVCRLLNEVDVNLPMTDVQCGEVHLTSCSALVLAVLMQRTQVVQLLMHAEADPSIEYSFPAGAEQIIWSGPVVHACIPSGDFPMLRELVRLKADLDVSSSNGATLVWQAAYFGQTKILEYLLGQGMDFERKAQSQDDTSLSLTPLHAAAKAGNCVAGALLLDAKASFGVDDGCGKRPLDDAVNEGHADVVQLLVSRRADIFQKAAPKKGDASGQPCRCIDRVFSQNNHILVAAVARGLKDAPNLPPGFETSDLVKFLSAPGDAAVEIWSAVFRRHAFKYWEACDGKIMRGSVHAAFVNGEVGMNIVLGPPLKTLKGYFQRKEVLPRGFREFKDKLATQKAHRKSDVFMPVTFHACQLPWLQEDLQVILAIADCSSEEVFGVPGCKAIVELKWAKERMGAQCRLVMAFVEVCNLAAINVTLNSTNHPLFFISREATLTLANTLAFAVWFVVTITEVAQCVGYFSHGLMHRYIMNTRHLFDMFALLLTGFILVWTWLDGLATRNSAMYRILLGFAVSLKWARLLISLRQLKSVGLRILPILNTMWDVGPFIAVLSVYLMGAVNMLYALGKHSIMDSFLIIYRLVVLGDVDLYELELGQNILSMQVSGDMVNELRPAATEYRDVVRILMVIVSFVMGVSMMNLFVAMLCVSYSEAAERAPLAFVRSVAGIVLDQHAARQGFARLFCCCCWHRRADADRRPERPAGNSESSNSCPYDPEEHPSAFTTSTRESTSTRASGAASTGLGRLTKVCTLALPWWQKQDRSSYIWFSMPLKQT